MKDQFLIEGLGGKRMLKGVIPIRGSKNAVLPIIASSILFNGPLSIEHIPHIEDVFRMLELLEDLNVTSQVDMEKRTVLISGNKAEHFSLNAQIAKRLRASIILSGPLLSRFGKVSFPYPGGCVIGKRPIDLFLAGFRKMGAKVYQKDERFTLIAPNGLTGTDIFFKVQSVTATETFLMAAILAKGKTTLRNAALEPEVESLALFLKNNGAHIEGIGTTTLTIVGGELLSSRTPYITIPDRIEAGSFLILGAIASNDLTITECNPEHLTSLIETLLECGVKLEIGTDFIRVRGVKKIPSQQVQIRTHEYPGFPTDLQAPLAVFLTQIETETVIFETIFEGRLGYMEDLKQMGGDITVFDAQRALVKGKTPLKNRELFGPDIRAGLAYIIAAIVAKGTSVVNNVYYIDRGYEHIEGRLSAIGVKITRRARPENTVTQ